MDGEYVQVCEECMLADQYDEYDSLDSCEREQEIRKAVARISCYIPAWDLRQGIGYEEFSDVVCASCSTRLYGPRYRYVKPVL